MRTSHLPLSSHIDSVQFGVLSSEEVLRISVAEVTEGRIRMHDRTGTLYDDRMGPMNPRDTCPTCHKKTLECPGHYGHISLCMPIVHPLHCRHVLRILQCVCMQCARLLVSEDQLRLWNVLRYKKEARFSQICDLLARTRLCVWCNQPQPQVVFAANESQYFLQYGKPGTVHAQRIALHSTDIYRIFRDIPDADVTLLGFSPQLSHPRFLILTHLLVLPPRARPFIWSDNKLNGDDLTKHYSEIIKHNNVLRSPDVQKNDARREKAMQTLMFWIRTLMDNSKGRAKHNNGRPLKAIKERLAGKDGLIRNNLMGKRQEQSARTVIGPDPTLCVDEIAIPHEIADTLTYPERVNAHNLETLQQLVWKDGANFVTRGLHHFDLKYALAGDRRYKFQLQIGDIVSRKLQDNDIVIVNRQPSLHKGSLIAQRIVRRPGRTIRLNLAVTASFNADFDGDEMNLFPPQSEQSRAELHELASLPNHIVGVQASKSNLTIVQDCLLGAYRMSRDESPMTKALFQQIANAMRPFSFVWYDTKLEDCERVYATHTPQLPLYCGKTLFSMLLPRDFFYQTENGVRIEQGVLLEGAVTKSNLGSNHFSIVRVLENEYGADTCIDFLNNVQFLALEYLLHTGFSVGMRDCVTTSTAEIQDVIARAMVEAEVAEWNTSNAMVRESRVSLALGKARDVGMRIAKNSLSPNNRFVDMVTSGSKGDFFNLTQIMGLLGQQQLDGARIAPTVSHHQRVLVQVPFSTQETPLAKEQEYEARGFVRHSFLQGLRPVEFWNHAATGRSGILDTSLKTSTSGYLHRKMVKIAEDCKVHYDGTVRNSVDQIIQFAYGGDHFDGSRTIVQHKTPRVCDIQRLAQRLNFQYEHGWIRPEYPNKEDE